MGLSAGLTGAIISAGILYAIIESAVRDGVTRAMRDHNEWLQAKDDD